MGFSAAAGHLILVVSLVSVGAVGLVKVWDTSEGVDEASRVRESSVLKKTHSSIAIDGNPVYQNGKKEYSFSVENTGDVVLDRDAAVFVVDGEVRNDDVITLEIKGATSSAVWLPDDILDVVIDNVQREPQDLWVVNEYGAVASYRR